jgi:hypothetical protein
MQPVPAMLADWSNFYVITGSAGAGLTGLTFVVIVLVAQARRANMRGLRAFVTPTIVHFCTVLGLAAFLCAPHQTATSLSIGLGAAGAVGLIYAGAVAAGMRRTGSYVAVLEDWLWHALLPMLAYGALLAMAFLTLHRTEQSLYGVAAVSMLLLFTGIHNAWDVAVSISIGKQPDSSQNPQRPRAGSDE